MLAAADDLRFRDFLTVALVVPEAKVAFTDNWIYIHAPEVKAVRIQNFGSWSPYLVKDGRTCLGLEYFVLTRATSGGPPPTRSSSSPARGSSCASAWSTPPRSRPATWCGCPRRTRCTTRTTSRNVRVLRTWLEANVPNVHPVGRNGMHKYNNQDHSMMTAMLTVENLCGASHDIWAVNVEAEYHETDESSTGSTSGASGTGRDAPILPKKQ